VLTLKSGDAAALSTIDDVVSSSPVVSGNMQVIVGGQNWSTRIQAVSPAYQQLQDWTLAQGSFFTDQDDASARNVAVLGSTVATNLFPAGQSPIGQLVRIRNVPFTVIGVLAPKGSSFGGDQDDVVLIPFQTGQVRLFGVSSINQIILEVGDASQMDSVQQQVEQLVRNRHQLQSTQG
jgi:putative ABC transport system permease protein